MQIYSLKLLDGIYVFVYMMDPNLDLTCHLCKIRTKLIKGKMVNNMIRENLFRNIMTVENTRKTGFFYNLNRWMINLIITKQNIT